MFGSLRFLLAVLVVLNHLWAPVLHAVGAHAVVGFYMLSGYLMTRVLHDTYGTDARNIERFLINRFLRVFPAYWLCLAASLIMLQAFPSTFSVLNVIKMPEDAATWLANILLINHTWAPARVVPPAWSLSVECFFYIAMPLLLSRSMKTATLWFAASLAITAYLLAIGAKFGARYYPIHAASLFFSAGAMIYFYQDALCWIRLPTSWLLAAVVTYSLLPLSAPALELDRFTTGYYGSALLFAPILVTLIGFKGPPKVRQIDGRLGDMAYPIFLGHFLAAGIVSTALAGRITPFGTVFALLSLLVTLAQAYAYEAYLDPWIQGIRARIRPRATRTEAGTRAP